MLHAPPEAPTDASVPLPGVRDPGRLEALRRTGLLDSEAEESFDRFTQLAKLALGMPVALVSLVDRDRQFFKSAAGLGEPWATLRETPLSYSFCQHVVAMKAPLVVDDASSDPRFATNAAVEELGVAAYAGFPLTTADGHTLGAFCAVSREAHTWTDDELAMLERLTAAVVTEIELRRAVRLLTSQRALGDAVFCHAGLGMVVADEARHISRANQALLTMLGYAHAELEGLDILSLAHPDDLPHAERLYDSLATGDCDVVQLEVRYRTRAGTFLWTRTTLSSARDPHGRVLQIISTVEEIEEARRTKEALRVSEDRYRTVLRHLPNASVVLFDLDLRVLIADGEELFTSLGLSARNARGCKLHELGSARNQAALEKTYRTALAGQKTTLELVRNGRDLLLHVSPVYDDSGRVTGGMVMTHDITMQKQGEREIRKQAQATKLLEDVATAANQAQGTAEAFERVLGLVARHVGFCIGHAFVRDGRDLVATDHWYLADPDAAEPFVRATAGLRYAGGTHLATVIDTREPLWLFDIGERRQTYPRWAAAAQLGLGSALGFPVLVGDEVAAVLAFNHTDRFEPDAALLALMKSVGVQLGRVVERERYANEVRTMSHRDDLTGLLNRRGFMDLGRKKRDRAIARNTPFVLLFVDLNGLKPINDVLGHETGDGALRDAADILRSAFPHDDAVGRLGGDEFVVLAEGLSEADAGRAQLRLRDALATFNAGSGRPFRLSFSIGTAVFDPTQPALLDALLAEADGGMYEQKRARRANGAGSLAPARGVSRTSTLRGLV